MVKSIANWLLVAYVGIICVEYSLNFSPGFGCWVLLSWMRIVFCHLSSSVHLCDDSMIMCYSFIGGRKVCVDHLWGRNQAYAWFCTEMMGRSLMTLYCCGSYMYVWWLGLHCYSCACTRGAWCCGECVTLESVLVRFSHWVLLWYPLVRWCLMMLFRWYIEFRYLIFKFLFRWSYMSRWCFQLVG